jgi:cysteine-rich repeat protein
MTRAMELPLTTSDRRQKKWTCLAVMLCIAFVGPATGQEASPLQSQNPTPRSTRIGSHLDRLLQENLPAEWIAIGVALRQGDLPAMGGPRQVAIQARQHRVLNSLARGSFRVKRRYRSLSGMALWVQRRAIDALSLHAEVEFLYLDAKVQAVLAQGVSLIGGDDAHALGYTGSGVKVAVLDTGIDTNHPDLVDDLVAQHCFCDTHRAPNLGGCCPGATGESTSAEDDEGHGTSVSGIITSSGAVAPIGVAPDAEIVAVKVLSNTGSGNFSDIAAGLDWVLTERAVAGGPVEGVQVVNMSLGDSGEYSNASANPCIGTNTANAIVALHAAGVAVFAASGNDGHDNGISFPACVAQAISVGGVYDSSLGPVSWCGDAACTTTLCTDSPTAADVFVCHSNSDELLDVLAPNYRTSTSGLGGGTTAIGGTSASGPYAAGEAALLLDVDDALTPEEIRTLLTSHGPQVTNSDNGLSFPRTDVGAAVAAIQPAVCGNAVTENGEDCDDGNTVDGDCCSGSCLFEPFASVCDDGDACSVNDSCDVAGVCLSGSPLICDDSLFCNGAETCDSGLGCQSGTAPSVDDGVACTDDSCDEASDLIVNAVNDAHCDNGLFCDGAETCDTLVDCQNGTAPGVDDGVACTDDRCDEANDLISNIANDLLCDDQDPCTAESCDEFLGCVSEPIEGCAVDSVPAMRSGGRLLLVLFALALSAALLASKRQGRARSARSLKCRDQ